MKRIISAFAVLAALQLATIASAQAEAKSVLRVAPTTGFIDDAIWSDGKTLAYIVTDAADLAQAHVVDVASKAEQVFTLSPALRSTRDLRVVGKTLVVIAADNNGDQFVQWVPISNEVQAPQVPADAGSAAIAPKPRTPKPPAVKQSVKATEARFATYKSKPVIVLYSVTSGQPPFSQRTQISVLDISTGRTVAKSRPFDLDDAGNVRGKGFRIHYWSEHRLLAHGIVEGVYLAKEQQRSPDTEGVFDVITGKYVTNAPIKDLFEQRKRFVALAGKSDLNFVKVVEGEPVLEAWKQGKKQRLENIMLANYRRETISSASLGDALWFGIAFDPANAAAVARKKLDTPWFEVFAIANDGAKRALQINNENKEFKLGAISANSFWLLERNRGFSRGGKALELYVE